MKKFLLLSLIFGAAASFFYIHKNKPELLSQITPKGYPKPIQISPMSWQDKIAQIEELAIGDAAASTNPAAEPTPQMVPLVKVPLNSTPERHLARRHHHHHHHRRHY